MLDNHPRHQLRFIIDNYGRSIIDDPRRCRGMLKDLAPKHQRETNLLMLALEQKLVAELTQKTHTPILMHLDILAQRLHNNVGIQKDFAVWAIESWALALDVIQQPAAQQTITPEPEPIQTAPIVSTLPQQKIGKFIVQDGVATDTETGLMWLRFAHGQRWENGTVAGDAEKFNWHDAMKIPQKFNRQGYEGYKDWRVPNIDELKTLVAKEKGNLIDVDETCFWSSYSPHGVNGNSAWIVKTTGISSNYGKMSSNSVRFVRGGKSPPKSTPIVSTPSQKIGKFIVQDGVATDTETGLMWLRFAHGQRWENGTVVGDAEEINWHDAMKIPDKFNKKEGYAVYNDWRVPNIDELKSIVLGETVGFWKGAGRITACYIDADVFPNFQEKKCFWSSSSLAVNSDHALYVGFYGGYSSSNGKIHNGNVRLVRQEKSTQLQPQITPNQPEPQIIPNEDENNGCLGWMFFFGWIIWFFIH